MIDKSPLEDYYKTLAGMVKWRSCTYYRYGYGNQWDFIYNDYIIHRYNYPTSYPTSGTITSAFYIMDLNHHDDGTDGRYMSPEDWGDGHWHTVSGYENLWIMLKRIDEKKWKKKSLELSELLEEMSLTLDK